MNTLVRSTLFWTLPPLVWGILSLLSVLWNLTALDGMALNLAHERAQSMFKLVQMTRLWNARHGGVYVPISETTPSNPYLKAPDKDVETLDGIRLTKLNPAYMTRQIADVARQSGDILFHITSLKPINPGNRPDSWERRSLEQFELATPEVLEYIENQGAPVYRYMGPLVTKKSCMKCHEEQGYEVGDIRGGISVTLAAEPILNAQSAARNQVVQIHLWAFILLTATTLFLLGNLRRQWRLQHKTKERLAARERFLSSITDAAGEGIVTIDREGAVTFANPEARRLLGWPDAKPGAAPETLHPKESALRASITSVANSAVNGDSAATTRVNDASFRHSDGSRVPVSYVTSPIQEGGETIGTVTLFRDTTLQKEMERNLVRSETMSALGRMVAGVAHEINTPIGVAVTSASFLDSKSGELASALAAERLTRTELEEYTEISQEASAIILSNLQRAEGMIGSFKQIAADQASEQKSRFDLKRYLESVLLTLRPELKKRAVKVSIDCRPEIELESYAGALSQVMTNLVMNSLVHAFGQDQTGEIEIEVEERASEVAIVYRDNGMGIPETQLQDVFAPFFTTRRGNGNSGLGLHIAHNLVFTVLRGSITLASRADAGVCFDIVLPKRVGTDRGED